MTTEPPLLSTVKNIFDELNWVVFDESKDEFVAIACTEYVPAVKLEYDRLNVKSPFPAAALEPLTVLLIIVIVSLPFRLNTSVRLVTLNPVPEASFLHVTDTF